jgi:hypothetical protein
MLIIKDPILNVQKLRDAIIKTESDSAFNTYYLAEAEVEIQTVPLFGIINIYVNNNSTLCFDKFMLQWKDAENKYGRTCNKAYHYTDKNTFPFGYVRGVQVVDRIFEPFDNIRNIILKEAYKSGPFKWFVNIIRTKNFGFLCSNELDGFVRDLFGSSNFVRPYLLSSASTIIYDTIELFKVETRQLDFPRVDQYTFHARGNIINDPIHFQHNPVITELILYYLNQDKSYENTFINDGYTVGIGHSEMYDIYAEEKTPNFIIDSDANISQYVNDVCFLLGCPLFGKCVRVDLSYKLNGKDFKKYIILSSLVVNDNQTMNVMIRHNGVYQNGIYAILSMCRKKFNIEKNIKIDAICKILKLGSMSHGVKNAISNMACPQNKKNLLEGILMNKYIYSYDSYIYSSDSYESREIIYVVNQNTNQIFVGFAYIKDVDVMRYANSSSVLFSYNLYL